MSYVPYIERGWPLRTLLMFGLLAAVAVQGVLAQTRVTHSEDGGTGSLRQAIIEANRHPGPDEIVFDIPETDAGFDGTYWTIALDSLLPALTDDGTRILGFSQAHNRGDTNAGFVGSGGSVGVDRKPLPYFRRPEIALDAGGHDGLTIAGFASDILIEGIAVFGGAHGIVAQGLADASMGAAVSETRSPGTNRLIRDVLVGVLASGRDPGRASNSGHGIVLQTSESGLAAVELDIEHCFVGHNGQVGIVGERPATTLRVVLSEVFNNGWATDVHDGIDVNGVNGIIQFNLSRDNGNASGFLIAGSGAGIEAGSSEPSTGDNLIENNTVRSNLGAGIAIRGGSSGNLVRLNIVAGNEVGIAVDQSDSLFTDRNIISENSTFRNRGIGIDLHAGESTAPFDGITLNSPDSGRRGPNLLQPYPIIYSAILADDTLRIDGFSSPRAAIEVFEADGDETGFGEGQRHLFTVTESSSSDLDGTLGEYGVLLDSVTIVSTQTLTTNRFSFAVPVRRLTAGRPLTRDRALLLTATERVGANTSEFGPTIRVVQLPGSVRTISPAENETDVAIPTTFRWSEAVAADTYEIQVVERRDSSILIVGETGLVRPAYRATRLIEDSPYAWRVRGRNAWGVGRWSDWSSFTTTIDRGPRGSPGATGLVYPRLGQTNVELDAVFEWRHVEQADRYRFQLSTEPPVSNSEFADTSYTSLRDTTHALTLDANQEYYWHVGTESGDSLVWSDEIWTFTTGADCAPPTTIVLRSPINGEQGVNVGPTFDWESKDDPAVRYTLEYTSSEPLPNGDFTSHESILAGEPPFSGVSLLENSTYYWRVRGSVCGLAGVWSPAWSFKTDSSGTTPVDSTKIVGSVGLVAPAASATGVSTITAFEWLAATNADTYRIEISGDSGFATIIDGADDLVTTSFEGSGPLENGQRYHWRVRGENPDSVGSWTQASFTTIRYHGEFVEPSGKTRLAQNRPNPFNPSTTIDFELERSSPVELTVYDIQGRRIRILASRHMEAGLHHAVWDGSDGSGKPVPSGVYIYRIVSADHAEAKRMLLLK